jgi:hypothetical protein
MTAANTYTVTGPAGLFNPTNVETCTVSTAAADAAAGLYIAIIAIKCKEGYGAVVKLVTAT